MSSKKIIEVIVGVIFIGVLIAFFRELMKLNESTKTTLYDDEALKELDNKEKRKKLDKYIEEYHKTGEWDEALRK
ncbi:MAG TPA: hypothetical protein VKX31_03120 [Brumimicrobium sp.]|nr:hypothetical protein [Brumimicrobium sp.]